MSSYVYGRSFLESGQLYFGGIPERGCRGGAAGAGAGRARPGPAADSLTGASVEDYVNLSLVRAKLTTP